MKIIDSFSSPFKWTDVHEYLFSLRAFFFFRGGRKVFTSRFGFMAQLWELAPRAKEELTLLNAHTHADIREFPPYRAAPSCQGVSDTQSLRLLCSVSPQLFNAEDSMACKRPSPGIPA